MIDSDFLWVERYRPKKIEDVILPDRIKKNLKKQVKNKSIPNMLLTGSAGVGKTTVARALLEEVGADYIVINGSLDAGIDVIRNDVNQFASSVSFSGGRKYVIFDEADQLSAGVQKALRAFTEKFADSCGFIFTCNYKARIIEPLHSRLPEIEFSFTEEETPEIAMQFYKRCIAILDKENIEYDKKVISELVIKYFPDFRRVIGELQKNSASGKIDESIFSSIHDVEMSEIFNLLKTKNFDGMRTWCAVNSTQDYAQTFRKIYDSASKYVKSSSMPGLIVTLSEYTDKHTRAIDPEINMAAFLTEIMFEATFL